MSQPGPSPSPRSLPPADSASVRTDVPANPPAQPSSESSMDLVNDLEAFLKMAVAQGVSDIHLRVGSPPVLRKDGDMTRTKLPPLTETAIQQFARRVIPEKVFPRLQNRTDFDFSFQLNGMCRFRVNLFYEMGQVGLVLRLIPLTIPTLDELGHPPVVNRFTQLHKGLVLVTGPTGSGKSTTLASMLNTINRTYYRHIVTLEDPVEYVYQSDRCVVTQRQLGMDTDSFPSGIKYALRQDPDVLLIGEMRDRETMMAALHAAETGHLVFSTLHTTDSVNTINRIVNAFEPHEREPIRHQLAGILQGTISQRLVKKAEGRGRLAVAEIMVVTPAIRDYIMRDQMMEIYQLLDSAEFEGANSLNHALYQACQNQFITAEDALGVSENPSELQQMLRGAFHGTTSY